MHTRQKHCHSLPLQTTEYKKKGWSKHYISDVMTWNNFTCRIFSLLFYHPHAHVFWWCRSSFPTRGGQSLRKPWSLDYPSFDLFKCFIIMISVITPRNVFIWIFPNSKRQIYRRIFTRFSHSIPLFIGFQCAKKDGLQLCFNFFPGPASWCYF